MNSSTDEKTAGTLWHYMTLEKFLWLLHDKRPYFSRLTKLQEADKKEGMLPNWLQGLVAHALKKMGSPPRDVRSAAEDEADRSYVFCWNKDECESYLMWAAYGDHGKGVCLQTTLSTMMNSLTLKKGPKPWMHFDMYPVAYIDHNDKSPVKQIYKHLKPPYSLAQFKSREFKCENELRMVATLDRKDFGGVPVELKDGVHLRFCEGGKSEPKFHQRIEKVIAGPKMDQKTFDFLKPLIAQNFPVQFFEPSAIAAKTSDKPTTLGGRVALR